MTRRFKKSLKTRNRKRKRLLNLRERIKTSIKITSIEKAKSFVKNLSQRVLEDDEWLLLSKGVKFIPQPSLKGLRKSIMNDFEEFERKLRCHYLFHDSKNDSKHPFYINSGYKPAYSCGTLENYLFATKYELSKINLKKMSPNLNKNEQKALRNLVKNKEIIVRKADKNSTLCILDKSTYIKEGLRQLENELYYEEINQSRIANATKLIHDLIEKWQRNDQIDKITYKFLLQNLFNKKIGKFFLLPKIHKIPPEILLEIENNPAKIIEYGFLGRPIVSLCGTPFHNLSHFIDRILLPLVQSQNTYIKDTKDFIQKLENLNLNNNILLATFDASNMYTNLEYSEIIEAVKRVTKNLICNNYPFQIPPIEDIIKSLEIILKNNEFTFNSKTYRQRTGVPMGGAASAELADIRMFEILEHILSKYSHRDKIAFCGRYRDDGFILFNGNKNELQELFITANKAHKYLKFTYEISSERIIFLDTEVYKGKRFLDSGILDLKTFRKPTETFQYLDRNSCHPKSVFKGFIKGEIIRNIRNTNDIYERTKIINSFREKLLQRNYKQTEIDEAIISTSNLERNDLLTNTEKPDVKTTIFITKYNPAVKQLKRSIIKHWNLIENDPELSIILRRKPVIAYKRHKNLQEKLTRRDKS